MRISDWSSDVCSSDLAKADGRCHRPDGLLKKKESGKMTIQYIAWNNLVASKRNRRKVKADVAGLALNLARSEEHTSELQSLMRTSYAVFCLKKKTPQ